MSQLSEIKAKLSEAIADLPGKHFVATGKTAYTEQADQQAFSVIVTLGPRTDEEEEILDGLQDPRSGVKAALEADRSLGGLVIDSTVTSCSGLRFYGDAGGEEPLIGAEWGVQVLLEDQS